MFMRMGTFQIKPGTLEALRQRYYTDCVPVVRAAQGSVDCYVLEPVDEGPVAIRTVWQTEAHAVAYEASGAAAEIVGRVREFFAGPPELRSYRIQRGQSRA